MGTFQSIEPASKQQQTNISLPIFDFHNQTMMFKQVVLLATIMIQGLIIPGSEGATKEERAESCNEEEGNKVHAPLAKSFDAPFDDCQSALSFYRKKLDIFDIDTKSICGKVNQELLMKFVFKTDSRKSLSRNMKNDEEPIRADITFGEICNCTCEKDMGPEKQ